MSGPRPLRFSGAPVVRQPSEFQPEVWESDGAASAIPDVPDDRRSVDVLNKPASPSEPEFYKPPTGQVHKDATALLRDAQDGPFTRTGRRYSENTRGPEREPNLHGCTKAAQRVADGLGVSLTEVQAPYRVGRFDAHAEARRTIARRCYAEGFAVADIAATLARSVRVTQRLIQDARTRHIRPASQDDGWPEKRFPWRHEKAAIRTQMEIPCAVPA